MHRSLTMWGKAAIAAASLAGLLLAGAPAPTLAQSGPVLRVAIFATGTSRIPAYTTTGEDLQIINSIYGSLLQFVPTTDGKIEPSLATSYTHSANAKTWTFQLRKGVQWQGGFGSFTCADVAFTWNFNKNPKDHSIWQSTAQIVQSVSCPNPYTAVFHLVAPDSGFEWDVVNVLPSTGYIMSQAAWKKLGPTGYENDPIGTGPYMWQSITPNRQIVLVRNPHFWGPAPAVAQIDFEVVDNNQTAALGVKTGSLDIAQIDPVTAAEYARVPGVHIVVKPTLGRTDYFEMNTLIKPLNNVLVRRAIQAAIDYPQIIQDVFRGDAVAGYSGLILKGQIGFDPAVNHPNTYNPALARKLLKESGVKLPITGLFFATYNDSTDIAVGQLIQADLAQVGIDIKSTPLERGTLARYQVAATTPANVFGLAEDPDPNLLMSLLLVGSAIPPNGLDTARYHGIDALYAKQNTAPSAAARIAYLKQIQVQLTKDVPAIDLYVQSDVWIVSNRVKDYYPSTEYNGDPFYLVKLG